jgi:hypothetical protein
LDNKIPLGWQKYTSLHEGLEKYLQQHYGIPWQEGGHVLADEIEKREWLKTRSLQEWNDYDKTVKFFSHLNAGGKIGGISLKRAFSILSRRRHLRV